MRTSVVDEHLSNVYRAIDDNELNSETDLITNSWKRCIQTFKLDPLGRQGSRVLTHSELQNHTSPLQEFITTAREGMETLYSQVEALGYVVLLCDKNGVTVDYIGNNRLTKDMRNAGLYLGSDWNERHAGTCAVGTIINELVPLTIHQQDHFDIVNTSLTCSASPILDHNGELLAILDVSALYSPKEKASQHLLLKLVQMHAGLIEAANFLNHYSNASILKFDTSVSSLNTYCPNLIALDSYNVVIGANQNARKIMARELGINDITSQLLTGFDITSLFQLGADPAKSSPEHFVIKSKNTSIPFFCCIQPPRTKIKSMVLNQIRAYKLDKMKPIAAEIDKLSGSDPMMHSVKLLISKFAPTDINILVQGETGTGKEVLANAIHLSSNRRKGPFVAVNCAALPDTLIESELFGYKAGSFTGASCKGKSGLILAADKGTLFLDEIGDMPVSLQTRLLRVLAEKMVTPIGSDHPIPVDFRLISATHQDITPKIESEQSNFRADLYHRLNGATVNLPPLRDRQDLPYLVSRIVSDKADIGFSKEAMQVLSEYSWPGNIRELKNVINYACTLCDDKIVTIEHLPEYVFDCPPFIFNENEGSHSQHAEIISVQGQKILQTLRNSNWNATEAAKKLETSRATLYRKMKKYNIVSPNNTDSSL
ncbi:sigma-54-dependent Fis family transcriptional regulator [Colwellia sp. E150_009]